MASGKVKCITVRFKGKDLNPSMKVRALILKSPKVIRDRKRLTS